MNHIVERLLRYGEFEVVVFGDDTILNKPAEEWPRCDCLLSWHSGAAPGRASLGGCHKGCCRRCVGGVLNAVQLGRGACTDASIGAQSCRPAMQMVGRMLSLRHPCHPSQLLLAPADGFPLRKAQQYVMLRKPYLVNDVMAQDILLDRRRVYRTLMVRAGRLPAVCGVVRQSCRGA